MFTHSLIDYVFDRRFLYQSITTLSVFIGFKVLHLVHQRKKRFQLLREFGIPGPEPNLLDGNLEEYAGKDLIHEVDEVWMKKYGKVFGFFIGDEPQVVITDLDMLSQIFLEENESFKERSVVFIDTALSHGILFAKFPRWRFMRKVMSPAFSNYIVRGSSGTQFIEDSIKLMVEYLERKADKVTGSVVDIHDLMKSTSLHLICNMAVKMPNVQVKEGDENVKALDNFLHVSDKGVIKLVIKVPFFRGILQFVADHFVYNTTLDMIHDRVDEVISKGLKPESGTDDQNKSVPQNEPLMDTLIRLHREGRMTRKEIMGNADALLFAGYDTTSTTLTYVFWVLSKNPDIQEKLRSDLKAYGIASQYLEQVINETFRRYPTVVTFTTRVATSQVMIGDWTIPQGCRVIYDAWCINMNPEVWPEPKRFDPERFAPGKQIHPCAFAPFGLGNRKCLGYQLAMLEMKTIICEVLMRFKLSLVGPQELELIGSAMVLTKPVEKVVLKVEKLWN